MAMKKRLFLLTVLVLITSGNVFALGNASAPNFDQFKVQGRQRVGTLGLNDEMGSIDIYKNTLPKIKSVTVTEKFNSGFNPKSKDPMALPNKQYCSQFANSPTSQEIKNYFEKANEISSYSSTMTLSTIPCTTEGKIEFENGLKGQWKINIDSNGVLWLSDGRSGYFYCPKCAPTFTLDDLDDATLKTYGLKRDKDGYPVWIKKKNLR